MTLLSLFFLLGAIAALLSGVSLLFPGGPLEPMWRINPRAHGALQSAGGWSVALLAVVSAACAWTGVGLWRGAPWGRRLALGLLLVNLAGDGLNAALGSEPRAAVGIPIAGLLIACLASRRARAFFAGPGS